MPIANCFVTEKEVYLEGIDQLALEWAAKISTDVHDITINVIPSYRQVGQTYSVMVNLFLPDFWTPDEVKGIQVGLLETICRCLKVKAEKVFIITSLITSGHVVEDGKIVTW
jgi:hypothetical protein